MKVRLAGTAALGGWPEPGCGCASCSRLHPGHRRPTEIVLDDRVRLTGPPPPDGPHYGPDPLPPGYSGAHAPDGWVVTGPDGGRMLWAVSRPQAGHGGHSPGGCDLVLIDPLERPERLGELRRRGVVTEGTWVVAIGLDHRVPTEAELARRLDLWGARAVPDGTVLDTGVRPRARPDLPRRTLLLGGSRSGKSAEAELRLAAEPEVVYVATGPQAGDDGEWLARVRAHRKRRPAHWRTEETIELAPLLRTAKAPLLVDGLGTWLAATFDACEAWDAPAHGGPAQDEVGARCDELVDAWRRAAGRVVAVSDEVGLGVVPATSSGRRFRDELGRLNQRLAAESEDVALVVAGRLLPLPIRWPI